MLYKELDKFNEDFLWGSASAAYQIEGASDIDGKGLSIWDEYVKIPGTTYKNTTGKIAVDHYNRFKEDVMLMKEMGLKAYRFSISWARIFPNGKGEINEKGLEFYNNLINELVDNGIEPVLTIYHWDLPQSLQDSYGGWESREIIADFDNYCRTLYKNFGDRVKYWITLNEQNIFIGLGYELGIHPPAVIDRKRMLEANHIANLANAQAIKSFRELVPNGQIGPSFAYTPSYASTCKPEDILAMENASEINSYWWLDVYLKGTYPTLAFRFMERMGLEPTIEDGDLELLKEGKPDFIGVNYYKTDTVELNPLDGVTRTGQMNQSGKKGTSKSQGIPGAYRTTKNNHLETTDWDWEIDPTGLRLALRKITSRYDNIPILITENGLGAFDTLEEDGIHDQYRIEFLKRHIMACKEAITDGVNLLGYCTWSFTDLLSWLNGYQKRYGFVYVDRDIDDNASLNRYKKDSFEWYKKVIESNGENL
ncbi:MAG: glycoside hydrolase family 1 protein [Sarcina sp.]